MKLYCGIDLSAVRSPIRPVGRNGLFFSVRFKRLRENVSLSPVMERSGLSRHDVAPVAPWEPGKTRSGAREESSRFDGLVRPLSGADAGSARIVIVPASVPMNSWRPVGASRAGNLE
jgi:hypothetical protein